MKIQLGLHGGIYGKLLLEPIETDDETIAFPEDLLIYIESTAFQSYKEHAGEKDTDALEKTRAVRSEGETYTLTIFHAPGEAGLYRFPKSTLEVDSNLERLTRFIWSAAKPVQN